jgi:hypothetical protein
MIPTGKQIDKLCATLLPHLPRGFDPQSGWYPLVNFCEDRNTLPELLNAVEQANLAEPLAEHLGHKAGDSGLVFMQAGDVLGLLGLPPRTVAIACLRALGKWPEAEWGAGEVE